MKKILERISISGCISALSFLTIFFLVILYIIGNIFNIDSLNRVFNQAQNRGFIWLLILFVVLCNVDYIKDILKSAVKERIDSLTLSNLKDELKDQISNDPGMLKRLKESEEKEEKQSFINKPINPN